MIAPDQTPDGSEDNSFWDQMDYDEPVEPVDWSGDELEQAYLKAMEVLEASDAQLPELFGTTALHNPGTDCVHVSENEAARGGRCQRPVQGTADLVDLSENATVQLSMPDSIDAIPPAELAAELSQLSQQAAQPPVATPTEQSASVTPRQILEALLFVGGEALTTKRLSHVMRGEFSAEYIESQIDELNALYLQEGRPYEIRFGDGGYRLTLRDDFEKIRRKAYGLGPKEVRLTQEALEVLAVLAYHQPMTATAIEELGKPGCAAILRQLLRRELICVERPADQPRVVLYRTTPRFLSLFGLRNLNELPRLEQVSYK